jgi:hypothetical protein
MRPEGGCEWEPLKIIAINNLAQDPSVHPNPRVLGKVWNSYEELHQHKNALGIHETKHGSKREETAQKPARYISPVDPTHKGLTASVKPMIQSLQ